MLWQADQLVVVATIIQEASNQGPAGMLAVAEVIRDRTALHVQSDGDLLSTCLWPFAFSGWRATDPNRLRSLRAILHEDLVVQAALAAWQQATVAQTRTAAGATHYLNPKILPALPPWAAGKTPVAIIGDHHFYRLVP